MKWMLIIQFHPFPAFADKAGGSPQMSGNG
jgi:hypothetical protein